MSKMLSETVDWSAKSYAELLELADLDGYQCVHDAHLGLNTYDCPKCCARREIWRWKAEA